MKEFFKPTNGKIALFIILLLFLPFPYFYKLTTCPEFGGATKEDCVTNTMHRFFYGGYFLYEQFITHEQPWNYFKDYHMGLFYVPLWLIWNYILSCLIFLIYKKVKKTKRIK